jgi:hypothetical protein
MLTPKQTRELKEHAQAIAAILYEQTEPEKIKTLAGIEKTVREQILEHITPEIGIFLSVQPQEQK